MYAQATPRLKAFNNIIETGAKRWVGEGAFLCPQTKELTDLESCRSPCSAIKTHFPSGCKHCQTCKAYLDTVEIEKHLCN